MDRQSTQATSQNKSAQQSEIQSSPRSCSNSFVKIFIIFICSRNIFVHYFILWININILLINTLPIKETLCLFRGKGKNSFSDKYVYC